MSNTGINFELLSRDNFDTWKIKTQALLIRGDHWDYVSGRKPKPAQTDAAVLSLWEAQDLKARSEIFLSISSSELKQVKNCVTSKELWDKLTSIYQSKGPARKASLLKQLILCKMKHSDDIHSHINNFFDVIDKLGELDIELNNDLLAIMLLYSLPEDYENFRCAIESRDDLPSPESLRIKIIEEYDSRLAHRSSEPHHTVDGLVAGSSCTCKSHNPQSSRRKLKCSKCGKFGHKTSDCRLKDTEDARQANALSTYNDGNKSNRHRWCLDSGCTTHMCSSKEPFKALDLSDDRVICLANNSTTRASGSGHVQLSTHYDQRNTSIHLRDTLYVPTLRTNLISVSKLTDDGYTVTIDDESARIDNQSGQCIAICERLNDLYYLNKVTTSLASTTRSRNNGDMDLWHRRYGHLNMTDLARLVKNPKVKGLKCSKRNTFDCEICFKGKMSSKPFPTSERSSKLLEIVHSDICGPMRIPSIGGAKYFITFIDDKTRWIEIKFLKNKSEAFEAFRDYRSLVENITEKSIKHLQTDRGGEFLSKEFSQYLKNNGIHRRLSCPYTPQQNGVAERLNRTLLDMARCMLIDSGMSEEFWAEAVNMACYIRNRSPSSSINYEVPYNLWTGKQFSVSHFRVFGCHAYMLDKAPGRSKFEHKSLHGRMVGYSNESKGYRLWIPEKKTVYISRHVQFMKEEPNMTTVSQVPAITDNCVSDETRFLPLLVHTTNKPSSPVISDRPTPENDEVAPSSESQDCHEEDEPAVKTVRAPGRPRKVKGAKGRPKKVYNTKQVPSPPNPPEEPTTSDEQDAIHNDDLESEPENVPSSSEFCGQVGEGYKSLREDLTGQDGKEWKEAVNKEARSLLKNKTWSIVNKPQGRKAVGCRWILRTKYNPDGSIERRKARLVAKGYTQRADVDYHETYAPVVRLGSVRLLVALAAELGMAVHQLDVETAYLNGNLDEDIYMNVPDAFEETLEELAASEEDDVHGEAATMLRDLQDKGGKKVCKLQRSLYGLKQAGRQWCLRLHETLKSIGLVPTHFDPCLYMMKDGDDFILVGVYVDDLLIACKNEAAIEKIKKMLSQKFNMKDMGTLSYCLGIEFHCSDGEITLSQKKYIKDLLEKFGMSDCKPVKTPMEIGKKFQKSEDSKISNQDQQVTSLPYRELIGSLLYLAVATRPDISYAVSALSQFNSCYELEHWVATKRVLRYLKGTADMKLRYRRVGGLPQGFADADWGNCTYDRRSYTGYAFTFAGAAVSWEARKQRTVALSSVEAEYMALTEASREAICLRRLFTQIGVSNEPMMIQSDSQGALRLAKNPVHHSRTKHIDIRHHFIRQTIEEGEVVVKHTATEDMVADIFTKNLPREKFQKCCAWLGLE